MAEGGSDDIVEKIVCGLCSEKYKQPKLLPCFHSYCLVCLDKYVESTAWNNKFDCPLCDTTIDIPEGGVNQFEWNIYIDSKLKSETDEKHDCDLCGPEVNAGYHCTECEENYCERCAEMHLKQKISRTHTLIAISDSTTGGAKQMKRKVFCTKHLKEEIKVVCKDCDKMLCVVCKLTDHEKHNSVDIEDEAEDVKKKLKKVILKAENSVSKLDKIRANLHAAKAESCKSRDNTLQELRDHGSKLKDQIDKKISEIEMSVNGQCKDACSNIASLSTDTGKIRKSLSYLSEHANQVISLSDKMSLVTIAGKVTKQLEECVLKTENHKVGKQDLVYRQWGKHLALVSCDLRQKLNNIPSVKSVTKIDECRYNKDNISNNVCSISTALTYCAMSCTDSNKLSVVNAPGSNFEQPVFVTESGRFFLCDAEDKVFLSHTAEKKVKVWERSTKTIVEVIEYSLYPHGIAHRLNNGHEELVVCFLADCTELMSTAKNKGTVKVVPLEDKRTPYDFMAETSPAPTRVAVNKLDGLVCLSYPSVGKICIHTKDGLTIHCFDLNALHMSQTSFRPFGICFDNENCIVIANRDGGQVLRVSILGHVIQTLVKGNKPTAVGVGPDHKLWVGYQDKNVTVFQMTNEN